MSENGQNKNMENGGGDAEEKPFSAKVRHHVMEPTHLGEMDKPDGRAVVTGPCGDTDEFSLRIFRDRIREIRFRTTGCFFTIAACDALATIAEGRTIDEGLRITQES
ncbi:MAG: iron-sulfur cluster assembly scaffold protein, partial [Deltaproteobacteria bacterium]|nr:iron-sulfur cluster assembly scaffold protein [Deltaproteobacteria bacterium]